MRKEKETIISEIYGLERSASGIKLLAATSGVGEGIGCIRHLRQDLKKLFEYRLFHVDSRTVLDTKLLTTTEIYTVDREDIQKELKFKEYIRLGNMKMASITLNDLFENEYLVFANPLILLKHKIYQLMVSVIGFISNMPMSQFKEYIEDYHPEQKLMGANNYFEIKIETEKFFDIVNDWLLQESDRSGDVNISKVKQYVRCHFSDLNINVSTIADTFEMNPTYLSRQFMRLTGIGLPEYIHICRIQEAKVLLNLGKNLAETANEVGYGSVLTMSRAFKKYEGVTPGKIKKYTDGNE